MFTIYDHTPVHDSDNMLFFAIVILAMGLMMFGHIKRVGIFNLLSVPFWIFLAYDLQEFTFLMISFIGLILFEVYWAFWGGTNL